MTAEVRASTALDAHVRRVIAHHFSPATGTPYWLRWAASAGWDPRAEVQGAADLVRFPAFDKAALRDAPHELWTPRALSGQPPHIFETGGTTGMPTQRLSWRDHEIDYSAYAASLDDARFPPGGAWLILGPTGPRRLRLAMEHLARVRGGVAYHVDLDPRWVRRLLAEGDAASAARYQAHVLAQAVPLLRHREVRAVFTTPRLLEGLADVVDLAAAGVRAVLCGGTSMSPQTVRFLVEEVLGPEVYFQPVYGNTLMGLASAEPVGPHNGWEVVYHAPQPRAVLRVVGSDGEVVPYGQRGQVELTTLTEELFMPRLLERDEAFRRPPVAAWPWDGVGDVRPLGTGEGKKTIEGVY
jgi:phenylacetate-coenzyme A ligase PaaK-like adenylate-forming protein